MATTFLSNCELQASGEAPNGLAQGFHGRRDAGHARRRSGWLLSFLQFGLTDFVSARLPTFGAFALAWLVAGCASPKQPPEPPAVAIAKQAVLSELGWKKVRAECDPAPGGGWAVTVWKLPEAPGRFVVVDVSADGRVTALHPGS